MGSGPGEMDSEKLIEDLPVVPPAFGKACCVVSGTKTNVESLRDVSLFWSVNSWFFNNVSTCSV